MVTPSEALDTMVENTVTGVVNAIPRIVLGLAFLAAAYVGVRVLLLFVRSVLDRAYPEDEDLVVDLIVTVVGVFLWFAVALTLLKLLGMGEVAAGIGTSMGFIALGVSYALSDMISDAVAGVYLLRDPDFNPGDTVATEAVTGTVRSIEIRKTRFDVEGDTVVVSNTDVEKEWTRMAEEGERENEERE